MKSAFFTEDHDSIREMAKQYAEGTLANIAADIDKTGNFPQEVVQEMAELGFYGLKIPEEFGGLGLDMRSYVCVMEEIAKKCAAATLFISSSNSLSTQPILLSGTEEQKEKYLPGVADGSSIISFALTEPNAGSDAGSLKTKAIKDGNDYILEGTKCFITMAPIADFAENNPEQFESIISIFNNPLVGVLVGAVFTGIIQSSAASVAILQNLAHATGRISFGMAIPIIMGQNIGTCVTSLISSIGVNKNARRVAVIHIMFNLIGTFVVLLIYIPIYYIFKDSVINEFLATEVTPFKIAIAHSVFNVFTTALLLPFQKMLVKLANIIIKDKPGKEEKYTFIDDRLLNTPVFAISECNNRCIEMASKAETAIISAINLCGNYDERRANDIMKIEDDIDKYEDKLGTYLVKLSKYELSDRDNAEVSRMLHSIGDFERLGDHAVNLIKAAREMHEKKLQFTDDAIADLKVAHRALTDIVKLTVEAYIKKDLTLANEVEPLEQVIDTILASIKSRHISRLKVGECTIEHGFVLNDMLTNLERVSDHCSNIAVTMIEVVQNAYDTHEYLNALKSIENEEFSEKYKELSLQYKLR